ncbi:MAG TPA: GlsB/YeaQ/YmgE family stress response membrane protein [Candidatus Eisenbacteria bacterium]|nr:GlsB/YeaQ/YmgE family stress response membrane protein [Candidatus Eisenbacteria bacterium]
MNILWFIIVGLVVGALAKLIMPGRDGGNILTTILLGIAGALLAGFIGRSMGMYREGEGAGIIASLIGAILLLAIYRMVRRKSVPAA